MIQSLVIAPIVAMQTAKCKASNLKAAVIKFAGRLMPDRITLRDVICFAKIFLLAISVSQTICQPAFARDYIVNKKAGGYDIQIRLDRYPLVMGDNQIEIEIRDDSNKSVDDAKVLVNYYMPPMPRMAPMNYRVKAEWRKKSYKAELDIIMAGPWYIKIIFKDKNRMISTKFNVDAQ